MSEVEEAAKRLRRIQDSHLFTFSEDGDRRLAGKDGVGLSFAMWRDIKCIVQAYLREHPAPDSDEPVTEELVRDEWNWEKVSGDSSYSEYNRVLRWCEIQVRFFAEMPHCPSSVVVYANHRRVLRNPTRGQLRSLLRCLQGDA